MSSGLIACLRALGKRSLLPTTQDSTCYGESSSSPQSFYAHHAAAISAAIVSADADTVANKASSLSVGSSSISRHRRVSPPWATHGTAYPGIAVYYL